MKKKRVAWPGWAARLGPAPTRLGGALRFSPQPSQLKISAKGGKALGVLAEGGGGMSGAGVGARCVL